MHEIGAYMQSVLEHWVAWGTGSVLLFLLWALETFWDIKTPKILWGSFVLLGLLLPPKKLSIPVCLVYAW